jgi:hypothetical protein
MMNLVKCVTCRVEHKTLPREKKKKERKINIKIAEQNLILRVECDKEVNKESRKITG